MLECLNSLMLAGWNDRMLRGAGCLVMVGMHLGFAVAACGCQPWMAL